MKLRVMGPADVVRAWAQRFAELLGTGGDFYPMRDGDGLRWYLDVDDRIAAAVAGGPPAWSSYRTRHRRRATARGQASFHPWEDAACGGCQIAAELRRTGNAGAGGAGCADHEEPGT